MTGNRRPYVVTFRPRPRAKLRTWVRYYEDDNQAQDDARAVVERETCGRGSLVSLVRKDDSR
jgi:hypothetical protein